MLLNEGSELNTIYLLNVTHYEAQQMHF